MKKNIRDIYFIEAIILFFIIIFKIIMDSNIENINSDYVLIGFFLIMLFTVYCRFKMPKDRNYLKSSASRLVLVSMLTTVLLVFGMGFFTGFSRSVFSSELMLMIKNVLPIALYTIAAELIRFIISRNSLGNRKPIIIYTLLLIVLNIIIGVRYYNFYDLEQVFKFICTVIFPVIAKESICSFITYNVSYVPSLLYRLPIEIYIYLLPILPDLGEYLYSVVNILLPFFLYLSINRVIRYHEKNDDFVKSVSKKIFLIPILVFLIIIVILISGVLKYKMIAIASNSMYPIYKRGDAVIYEKVSADTVGVGDVLVFRNGNMIITHRITKIYKNGNTLSFKTKGDNNENEDNFVVSSSDVYGIVRFVVRDIGYPTVWIQDAFEEGKE